MGRSPLRGLVLLTALVPMAFDEYLPLLARDAGVATASVPLVLLVPAVATILASAVSAYRPVGRVARVLVCTGLLVIAGALLHSVPGVLLVGLSFGIYQLARITLEARIQDAIEGDARATVTSVMGVLEEANALTLFAAYGLATGLLELPWLIAANGVLILVAAA